MADGKKISELTESASIEDAHFFPVSDGTDTKKVAYSTIKNDLIDYSADLAGVISPTVTPTEIEGGHRVTVVDIDGTKTFDVMDGEQGPQGEQGPKGETGATGYPTNAQVDSAVDEWLTEHPEATTTVQPNTVTDDMLVQTGGVLDRVVNLGNQYEIFNETFIRGGIANDGSINSETHRVVTQNILQYGYPLFIKLANSDYRFRIAFYESDSDTLVYMTGYGQGQQFIEEGARFRISIAKVTETATLADVTVFRNSVVKKIEPYMDYLRVSSQENAELLNKYIQQRWQNKNYDSTSGAFVYGGYRAIAQPLAYPFDIVVTNNDSTLYHFNIKYWSDTPAIAANYIQSSGWIDDSYTIKKDTYFTIEYARKVNSTPLPSNANMANLISFTTVGLPYDLALDAINCEIHETSGYYNADGGIWPANSTYQEVYTQLYPMSTEIAYEISLKFSSRQAIVGMYALFDKNKKFVERLYFSNEMGYEKQATITTENANIAYVAFSYRTYGDVSVKLTCQSIGKALTRGLASLDDAVSLDAHFVNPNVNSINHRGYNTEAPENTLPAYRMSRRKGFKMVECDVQRTSDGVFVLLHDTTINRTARNADGTEISGTVSISSITYAQALAYDFGIWKGQQFAGTKIPTLVEFVTLCRNIGLQPYIELKEAVQSQESVSAIVDIVRNCGMAQKVTWVSFSSAALGYVLAKNPKARVGVLANSVDASVIANAQALMNGENDVFINSGGHTDAQVELCQSANIPMEVWNFDSTDTINALPTYVSGITSDNLVASYVLHQSNI